MTTPIQIFEAPWPDRKTDRAARCQECGQLLGKRCLRDGCGRQIVHEDVLTELRVKADEQRLKEAVVLAREIGLERLLKANGDHCAIWDGGEPGEIFDE